MKLRKITRKASDVAKYIELFGSSTRDRHALSLSLSLSLHFNSHFPGEPGLASVY